MSADNSQSTFKGLYSPELLPQYKPCVRKEIVDTRRGQLFVSLKSLRSPKTTTIDVIMITGSNGQGSPLYNFDDLWKCLLMYKMLQRTSK